MTNIWKWSFRRLRRNFLFEIFLAINRQFLPSSRSSHGDFQRGIRRLSWFPMRRRIVRIILGAIQPEHSIVRNRILGQIYTFTWLLNRSFSWGNIDGLYDVGFSCFTFPFLTGSLAVNDNGLLTANFFPFVFLLSFFLKKSSKFAMIERKIRRTTR